MQPAKNLYALLEMPLLGFMVDKDGIKVSKPSYRKLINGTCLSLENSWRNISVFLTISET
jgi:hypothetical protein